MAENDSILNSDAQIDSILDSDVQIDSDLESVTEVSHIYHGLDTNDISVNVNNETYTISATLIPFDWLEYDTADWVQTSSYYKLVIPFATHKCLNAYVASMMIGSPADEGDQEDEAGFENNIPTWKLLSNDSIVIKSEEPLDCRVLIKGER